MTDRFTIVGVALVAAFIILIFIAPDAGCGCLVRINMGPTTQEAR